MRVERTGARAFRAALEETLYGVSLGEARASFSKDGALDAAVQLLVGGGTVDVTSNGRDLEATIADVDLAKLERLPEALAGLVSGRVIVEDAARVKATVKGRGIRAREWTVERLDVEAAYADDAITLTKLEAFAGEDRIVARGVAVEPDRPYFVAAVDEVDVLVRDVGRYVPDLPAPVRVDMVARSPDGRAVTIRRATVVARDSKIELKGRADLPEDPDAWKDTVVDLTLDGTLVGIHRWHESVPLIEGTLSLAGSCKGRLDTVLAKLRVAGEDLRVEGRAVRKFEASGDVLWPDLRDLSATLVSEAGRVTANGSANLETATLRDGRYEIDVTDLASLLAMVPDAPKASGALKVRAR